MLRFLSRRGVQSIKYCLPDILCKPKQNVSIKVKISPMTEVSFSIIFVVTITLTYQSKISTLEIY